MTNSYLGIISPRGLETLVVETEHAALFLARRMARFDLDETIGCWAVLDDKKARDISRQIRCGRFREALCRLNTQALHLGTVLLPVPDDDLLLSAS